MSDEKIGYYAPGVPLPRCNTPAPVASNGAWLIACQEPRDHDGTDRFDVRARGRNVVTPFVAAEPGARPDVPTQPGPVGLWLLDGWWQHTIVRWPIRGLQYELGTRVVATMRRRLG